MKIKRLQQFPRPAKLLDRPHGPDRPDTVQFWSADDFRTDLVRLAPAAYLFAMRFSADSFASHTIRAYSDGEITVNEKIINRSIIITADVIQLWEPAHIDELTAEHCEIIAGFNPEVVIIGTGKLFCSTG